MSSSLSKLLFSNKDLRARMKLYGVIALLALPLLLSLTSPLLAWRSWVYIGAGVFGVVALTLLVMQPLLAARFFSQLHPQKSLRWHRFVGMALCAAVILHVAGLWLTSPPDVIDALLARSPTPFSLWGVLAMWAVFLSTFLAMWQRSLNRKTSVKASEKPTALARRKAKRLHLLLALVIALCTALHAILIDGTMEPISKALLSAAAILACGWASFKHWNR